MVRSQVNLDGVKERCFRGPGAEIFLTNEGIARAVVVSLVPILGDAYTAPAHDDMRTLRIPGVHLPV